MLVDHVLRTRVNAGVVSRFVSSNELPLSGLRVIDMADVKGELAGRLLADFGADVIRVEPPGGAASRKTPPFTPDGETSLYFAFRNFNKRASRWT